MTPTTGPPPTQLALVPSPEFLAHIPHEFARRHLVLSAGVKGRTEHLHVAASTSPWAPHNVGTAIGRPVSIEVSPAEHLAAAIDSAYTIGPGRSEATSADQRILISGGDDVDAELREAVHEADRDLLRTDGKAPAMRLVDLLLFEALQRDASDVHIQPARGRTLVRFRLDGVLHTTRELPASVAAPVVTRIKVMARLDVAEHRASQDGRATVTIGGSSETGRRVDLRIATLPTTYGERVVVRLLDVDRARHAATFRSLGMAGHVEAAYLAQVSRASGIVLSTGPTGSGKTTTLYTTLAWISAANAGRTATGCELNMMTIEDPVEYDLSASGLAVSQTQVDPKRNVTFATGLRHILRQDPDVVMVGEIRDAETARTAVQASLTGHLVLSTLHTNDAAGAAVRLLDLDVEPFLVSSSLTAVLAQRLVRTVHKDCLGRGCPACLSTGFKGRTGIFELLQFDDELRELIAHRASAARLKEASVLKGMETLARAGQRLVSLGVTTQPELARSVETRDEHR